MNSKDVIKKYWIDSDCEVEQRFRKELLNLEYLLNEVGGNGENIIRNLSETSADKLMDVLIRNGITLTLTPEKKRKLDHKVGNGTEIIGP